MSLERRGVAGVRRGRRGLGGSRADGRGLGLRGLGEQFARLGRLRTVQRVLRQQTHDHAAERGARPLRCGGIRGQCRHEGRIERVPLEGGGALDGEVERDAEREQVGRGSRLAAGQPLGRHIARGADHHAALGDPGLAGPQGDAVVGEQHPAVGGTRMVRCQQQVGGLHVPVDDAEPVSGREPVEGGRPDPRHLVARQRAVLPHHGVQVPRPRQVLHHDPRAVLGLHHVVHRDHVRVLAQLRRPQCLLASAADGVVDDALRLVRYVDLLDRDLRPEAPRPRPARRFRCRRNPAVAAAGTDRR